MFALCLAMVEPEERDAFTDFFDRYHKLVLFKALEITQNRETAEDVAQEMFLYAAKNFEKFKTGTEREIRHYLMICTQSRAMDAQRKNQAAPEPADEDAAARAAVDDTERIVLRRDTLTRLLRYIDELDERYRAPLKLWMDGVPYSEIAQMLNITKDNAYKRTQRAYALLRERMVREDEA